MKVVRRITSWLAIAAVTIETCAAFAFLFIGAWWCSWLIVCAVALIYVFKIEW